MPNDTTYRVYINYDEEGKVRLITLYDNDGTFYRNIYHNSSDEFSTVDLDSSSGFISFGRYHKDMGHPLEIYDISSEELQHYSFEYNKAYQLVSQKEMGTDGKWKLVGTYEYDTHGNITKVNEYEENGEKIKEVYRYTYKYDSKGNWIEKEVQCRKKILKYFVREITYYE